MSRNEPQPSTLPSSRFTQLWLRPPAEADERELVYRPAVLVECIINFRSIKVGLNDSQERVYSAWLPDGTLPVDWDTPLDETPTPNLIDASPAPGVRAHDAQISLDDARADEIEADLVNSLVRRERLRLLYNPPFNLFSAIGESKEDFTARVAEAVLDQIEPEMKKLKSVFDLRLEQIREAQLRKDAPVFDDSGNAAEDKADLERLLLGRTEFLATEKRIASLFTGRMDLAPPVPRPQSAVTNADPDSELELQADLRRVEHEAAEALRELHGRYLEMVHSYDVFEVGIQASNIRILRRAILWVPVTK
jgi:hypothetical protein